jgi:hypothetical protein
MAYFDMHQVELPSEEPGFRTVEERRADEEEESTDLEEIATSNTFGLGPLVDKVMEFNPFTSEEVQESTDDEVGLEREDEEETQEEAKRRRSVELQRRRDEKAKLVAKPAPAQLGEGADGENEGGGWQDMAWLLSVASKALF